MFGVFGEIANHGANIISGASTPVASYYVMDFRSDDELIKRWGQICRRSYRWQSGWGDWNEVQSAKHPTMEDANAEARKMALDSGYRVPRWWEFWRINETPLPGNGGK